MALVLAKAVTILLLVMTSFRVSFGAIYKVGDSAGWTNTKSQGNVVDYKKWPLSKSFRPGDTLLFEYNPRTHNVMQVNRQDFVSCKSTDPISTYSTGKDLISLTAPGHYYFVRPNHCEDGLKFAIRVSKDHRKCRGANARRFGRCKSINFSGSLSLHSFDDQLVTKLILVAGVLKLRSLHPLASSLHLHVVATSVVTPPPGLVVVVAPPPGLVTVVAPPQDELG
ncbi:hypothetical protein EZV62_022287 [Acer yangbiense]|uniref:Phytocyanin domain-containing protein n=1 Tax=Acer yangbiense TaxID=1000413 RepID=A0A5C7H7U7_9ROSI|nr:hypothetical protein EZV62_022287 [Acer yangbiense]